MTTVLFWDIDGTLLTTKRAGIRGWELSFEEVAGRPADLGRFATAGLTDVEVARRILEREGASPDLASRLLAGYERRLPACLPRRDGHAIPEARRILEALNGRTDVASFLLTGNTRPGAEAKLRFAGLWEFFAGGAFSNPLEQRPHIAREALAFAERHLGEPVPPERRIVIGDTPHDMACARAIDARALGVATGPYGPEALRECGAWRTVDRLPTPVVFARMVGLREAGLSLRR